MFFLFIQSLKLFIWLPQLEKFTFTDSDDYIKNSFLEKKTEKMDWRLEHQRIYDNRNFERRRNWERFHNLLQILNEAHTCPYDDLSGNTRGRSHLREDVVRAHLVQGFMLLTSIMFNFGKFTTFIKVQKRIGSRKSSLKKSV